jgi:hypothetical protein
MEETIGNSNMQANNLARMTRLGELSHIGILVTMDSVSVNYRISPLGGGFFGIDVSSPFDIKTACATVWAIFHNLIWSPW